MVVPSTATRSQERWVSRISSWWAVPAAAARGGVGDTEAAGVGDGWGAGVVTTATGAPSPWVYCQYSQPTNPTSATASTIPTTAHNEGRAGGSSSRAEDATEADGRSAGTVSLKRATAASASRARNRA